jgi:hypothetical protein
VVVTWQLMNAGMGGVDHLPVVLLIDTSQGDWDRR